MRWVHSFLMLAGRVLISLVFISAGFNKIVDWEGAAQYMAAKGMTQVPFFLLGALLVELIGGLFLFTGYKVRWGALVLFLYLIPVTYIFHDFWTADAASRQMQMIQFLKNLAIMGGLLHVLATGAGCCSMDHCCRKKSKEPIKGERAGETSENH